MRLELKRTYALSLFLIALGLGLLIFTFMIAYAQFKNPSTLVKFYRVLPTVAHVEEASAYVIDQIVRYLTMLLAILLLVVMAYVGGKILSSGVELIVELSKSRK